MEAYGLFLWIGLAIVLPVLIIWFVLFLKKRRHNAKLPVRINYIYREMVKDAEYMYLELEIENLTGDEVILSEIQQRHLNGPLKTFLLEDAQGNRKRSLFEARERFTRKVTMKPGEKLLRNYRMRIFPSLKFQKLFLQYQVVTKDKKGYTSKSRWVVPNNLEEKAFKPSKGYRRL